LPFADGGDAALRTFAALAREIFALLPGVPATANAEAIEATDD
jgi:hypothetical protein